MKVTGRWVPSPEGKKQSHELHASEVMMLGLADPVVCKALCGS